MMNQFVSSFIPHHSAFQKDLQAIEPSGQLLAAGGER